MESILHLCSPTLENLNLRSVWGETGPYSFKSQHHFPKLHHLSISWARSEDTSVPEALVKYNLRYLKVGMASWDPVMIEFFSRCGTLPLMNTLVWYHDKPEWVQEPPTSSFWRTLRSKDSYSGTLSRIRCYRKPLSPCCKPSTESWHHWSSCRTVFLSRNLE